jgi:hypothetical protein
MAVSTLTCTAVSIRSAKAGYVYGASSYLPLQSAASSALVRCGMPSDIPAGATITSAILTFTQHGAQSGSVTLTVQRQSTAWTVSKATWTNRGNVGGTAVTPPAKTSAADLTLWAFDVTVDVQAFIAAQVSNYGWRLSTTSSTALSYFGSSASINQPTLTITYLVPGDPPIGLTPSGNQATSLAKPVLTFQAPPDTTQVNVQIDADMNTPYDFDSGDINSTSGFVDTSTTAWAGLTAGGASLYWRARVKSSLGYSGFSAWAQMRRVAKPTVTITSPGATSDDTTPPVVWSTTGTQVSWRVIITNSKGQTVADSGQIVGTDTTWTPPKTVATDGQQATVEVRIWDNIDRVATQGDPVYANALLTFTVQGVGTVAAATTMTATKDNTGLPLVTITATRGTAPDSWQVWRDDGAGPASIATALTSPLSYQDWTADPNKAHTYFAVPFINGTGRGLTTGAVPKQTVTPTVRGIWLVDPANPTARAVIWGQDTGDFDATELAVIHQPLAGPPVRRVSYRPPLSGSVTGELVDVGSLTADAQIAVLYDMKGNDRDLRLVLGDRNLLVRIGDLLVHPTPDSNDASRHSLVSFTWWEQGTPPWSP